MNALKLVVACVLLAMLQGCATLHGTSNGEPEANNSHIEFHEDELLDVWIEIFDPGTLPGDEEELIGLSMEIRDAEARFMPVQLRNTMEKTGYWGAVRVVPRGTEGAEVLVTGSIQFSNGETMGLRIAATDATGRQWFTRTYQTEIPLESWQNNNGGKREAFQVLYNAIANDLARYRERLDTESTTTIRRVAELRFANALAPDAFSGYLVQDADDNYNIKRLPARDDPMYRRIQAIRERDFLLIDTLNGHYDNFHREMEDPYREWRQARTEEVAALRELEAEATRRKWIGAAAIAGAIALEILTDGNSREATQTLRDVMVIGGLYSVKTGLDKDSETVIHRDAVEELGKSFSAETRPLVVDVEGETHELAGSAEEQYAQWRTLLKQIYAEETGIKPVPE